MPDGVIWNDPEGCHDWEGRWLPDLAAFDPDVVFVHLAWPGFGDRYVDGHWRHPCEPEFDTWYLGEVGAALDVLGSSGARIVIADAPYWQLFPLDDGERVDCLNAVYVQAAREHGADVIGLREWLCPDRRCAVARDDVVLRPDGVHFMDAGADIAGRWVLGEITRLVLASP